MHEKKKESSVTRWVSSFSVTIGILRPLFVVEIMLKYYGVTFVGHPVE